MIADLPQPHMVRFGNACKNLDYLPVRDYSAMDHILVLRQDTRHHHRNRQWNHE